MYAIEFLIRVVVGTSQKPGVPITDPGQNANSKSHHVHDHTRSGKLMHWEKVFYRKQ